MNHDSYPDDYLRDILTSAKMIAVVGASPRPQRPSHGVMRYLQGQGYRAIPVNPFVAGGMIHGERCYASLAEIPEKVDMVDVFRRADMAGGVVEAAIDRRQDHLDAARGARRRGGGAGRGARHPGGHEPLPGDRNPAIGVRAKLSRGAASARFV